LTVWSGLADRAVVASNREDAIIAAVSLFTVPPSKERKVKTRA